MLLFYVEEVERGDEMELFPKVIEKQLPKLLETDNVRLDDVVVHVKFFNPVGLGAWYATEYDSATKEFFGYCSLNNQDWEWGSFYLDELQHIQLPCGFSIERDIFFTPKKFSELNL